MDQGKRLQLVSRAIRTGRYTKQSELLDALRERGLKITQPSLSRDLQKLAVTKVNGIYELPVLAAAAASPSDQVSLQVTSGNLVIVKTAPGHAGRIAYYLDEATIPGVAGTLSGDDTIFIAISDNVKPATVLSSVKALLARITPAKGSP